MSDAGKDDDEKKQLEAGKAERAADADAGVQSGDAKPTDKSKV
jgi:hypothetical protein